MLLKAALSDYKQIAGGKLVFQMRFVWNRHPSPCDGCFPRQPNTGFQSANALPLSQNAVFLSTKFENKFANFIYIVIMK